MERLTFLARFPRRSQADTRSTPTRTQTISESGLRTLPSLQASKRIRDFMAKRVYFAFHYQDVIDFRANVVRNHNAIQGADRKGYFDASIWEESKRSGDLA